MLPWGVWLLSLNTGHCIADHLPKSPHNYKKTQTQSDIEQSGAPSKYYGGCDPPLWVIIAIWFFVRFCAPSDSSCCNFRMQFSKQILQSTTAVATYHEDFEIIRLEIRAESPLVNPAPGQQGQQTINQTWPQVPENHVLPTAPHLRVYLLRTLCRPLSPLSRLSIRTIYNQYLMRDILCHVFLPIFFASTRW
jgi:hypothetical protein